MSAYRQRAADVIAAAYVPAPTPVVLGVALDDLEKANLKAFGADKAEALQGTEWPEKVFALFVLIFAIGFALAPSITAYVLAIDGDQCIFEDFVSMRNPLDTAAARREYAFGRLIKNAIVLLLIAASATVNVIVFVVALTPRASSKHRWPSRSLWPPAFWCLPRPPMASSHTCVVNFTQAQESLINKQRQATRCSFFFQFFFNFFCRLISIRPNKMALLARLVSRE
jgi:hypothetical protein